MKLMAMGPPKSTRTLAPERGGNSSSNSEIPELNTVAFVKVRPGIWVVIESRSEKLSKLKVNGAATYQKLSGSGRLDSSQNLHERTLARSVLSDNAVNFAGK